MYAVGPDEEGKTRVKVLLLQILVLSLLENSAFAKNAQVEVQKFDDVTHLEFSGLEDWNVTRQKDGDKFTIVVPKLDNAALVDLKTLSDGFVKKVTIQAFK